MSNRMTREDAERIERSGTDPDFIERAKAAAERNDPQAERIGEIKKVTPMNNEAAKRIGESSTDPGFKQRAQDAAEKNERKFP